MPPCRVVSSERRQAGCMFISRSIFYVPFVAQLAARPATPDLCSLSNDKAYIYLWSMCCNDMHFCELCLLDWRSLAIAHSLAQSVILVLLLFCCFVVAQLQLLLLPLPLLILILIPILLILILLLVLQLLPLPLLLQCTST